MTTASKHDESALDLSSVDLDTCDVRLRDFGRKEAKLIRTWQASIPEDRPDDLATANRLQVAEDWIWRNDYVLYNEVSASDMLAVFQLIDQEVASKQFKRYRALGNFAKRYQKDVDDAIEVAARHNKAEAYRSQVKDVIAGAFNETHTPFRQAHNMLTLLDRQLQEWDRTAKNCEEIKHAFQVKWKKEYDRVGADGIDPMLVAMLCIEAGNAIMVESVRAALKEARAKIERDIKHASDYIRDARNA